MKKIKLKTVNIFGSAASLFAWAFPSIPNKVKVLIAIGIILLWIIVAISITIYNVFITFYKLKKTNKNYKTKIKELKVNRRGLQRQIKMKNKELDQYQEQVVNLEEQNEKISNDINSMIANLITNSVTVDFLYKQVEAIQSSIINNNIIDEQYFSENFLSIANWKAKILKEQETNEHGKEIENH